MNDLKGIIKGLRPYDVINKYFSNGQVVEKWSKEKYEEYSLDAINELCKFVYDNNEYYRNKLDKIDFKNKERITLEDFQKIGFLKKDELRENNKLILSVPMDEIAQVHTSTGTTGGDNIYMMYTLSDLYVRDLAPDMDEIFEIGKGDVVIIALPYEMSSSGQSFHRVIQFGKKATAIPTGKGGFYSKPEKALKIMKDLKANIIISTPSYIMNMYKKCKKLGYVPNEDFNIKEIWLTGEGCSNNFRKRIEDAWGCVAKFYYGSLEAGAIGIECDEKNGYHITAGHTYVEIVNPVTGETMQPGEIGEVVITSLLREGTPLIRYRTEDLGYIEEEECGCGCKLPKLFLRGRQVDQINIEGKSYSPIYIEEKLMSMPEVGNDYKIFVYDDYINIQIEVTKKVSDKAQLEEAIGSKLEFLCGVPNKIEIVDEIEYPGGKAKRVTYLNK